MSEILGKLQKRMQKYNEKLAKINTQIEKALMPNIHEISVSEKPNPVKDNDNIELLKNRHDILKTKSDDPANTMALVPIAQIRQFLPIKTSNKTIKKLIDKGFDLKDIKTIGAIISEGKTNVSSVTKWYDQGISIDTQQIILKIRNTVVKPWEKPNHENPTKIKKGKKQLSFKIIWEFFMEICEQDVELLENFFETCKSEILQARFLDIGLKKLIHGINNEYNGNIIQFLEEYRFVISKQKTGRVLSDYDIMVEGTSSGISDIPEIEKARKGKMVKATRVG